MEHKLMNKHLKIETYEVEIWRHSIVSLVYILTVVQLHNSF